MAHSLKNLDEQVIVITGSSSGIGLATARAAAAAGAKVVLTARNGEALSGIEQEIRRDGGDAIHVVADVGRREDVQRVCDRAIEHYGGFDTWVNNAGVSVYGPLAEVTEEDSRRLFDTNFWGVVAGSLAAAAHLKTHGGAIINIGSELSDVAIPLQGMYSASKHAVRGFTDALRMELERDGAPISVTLIKPASIATPYPEHAKKYSDRQPTLPPPIYAPDEVARAILHAAHVPSRDIFVGAAARVASGLRSRAPRLSDRLNRGMADMQFTEEAARDPAGALHEPGYGGHEEAEYAHHVMRSSLYTRAAMHPALTAAAVTLAASAGLVALMSAGRHASDRARSL